MNSLLCDENMAALEQLEALRMRNKQFLEKLKKQADKLQELKLSVPDEDVTDKITDNNEFTGSSGPLNERNVNVTQASTQTNASAVESGDEGQHEDEHTSSVYSKLLQDTQNHRWQGRKTATRLAIPKSASVTTQREVDRTASLGSEIGVTSERRRIRPLLGYDWIAGLVDAESSLTERSEQFYSDLQNFRQVNRDECVLSLSGPPLAVFTSSTLEDEEPQETSDTHRCTYCYRINARLFATPLDPRTACPVCKTPKSEHAHTETDPAIIRVSIPRSTLLPSYRYKAHRRCSFDTSDSLGLPSHCLSGWTNPTINPEFQMNSLDLRESMKSKSTQFLSNNNEMDS